MAVLVAGTEICSVCGESNKMAVLECLHPIGDISSGASWSLYPRSYTVGSGTAADIVLTGAQVPDVTFSLKYMGGGLPY